MAGKALLEKTALLKGEHYKGVQVRKKNAGKDLIESETKAPAPQASNRGQDRVFPQRKRGLNSARGKAQKGFQRVESKNDKQSQPKKGGQGLTAPA